MLSSENVSTKIKQIAERAKVMSGAALTSLSQNIDIEFMREAYRRTRKGGATGIDGQSAELFADNLEANLQTLLDGLKSGKYKAPPVRRVYIPKDGGKLRPLGIPTFGDKVLQMAVKMILEAVYEQDFLESSYGFRPGRSQHHALDAIWESLKWDGGWVLEIDFASFFDTISHQHLRAILDERVRDGVIRKMIDKWLKAGVLEEGKYWSSDSGTPQGGIVSPILSNIFLHTVLDKWFEEEVKPRMKQAATLVRYADDAVFVFKSEADARRVLEVLPKRCARFELTLHPEKTKLVRFVRPLKFPREGAPAVESFDFLGFTHYWGRSLKGGWVHKRKTRKGRLQRALSAAWEWCRDHRHFPVPWQVKKLRSKLIGHYRYYGLTGNFRSLEKVYRGVRHTWRYWLNRRGQRKSMPWARFLDLLLRYPLPKPVVYQSIYRGEAKAHV